MIRLHRHTFMWHRDIHGDEINHRSGMRSEWLCQGCCDSIYGRYLYRDDLTEYQNYLLSINSVIVKGSTRTVLLYKDWAIKIPRFLTWKLFLQGLLANMQERNFWTTKWPELCPIVWSTPGGFVVVMERARPVSEREWANFDIAVHWSTNYKVPVEMKQDSFGVINNKIVAVDYGS